MSWSRNGVSAVGVRCTVHVEATKNARQPEGDLGSRGALYLTGGYPIAFATPLPIGFVGTTHFTRRGAVYASNYEGIPPFVPLWCRRP